MTITSSRFATSAAVLNVLFAAGIILWRPSTPTEGFLPVMLAVLLELGWYATTHFWPYDLNSERNQDTGAALRTWTQLFLIATQILFTFNLNSTSDGRVAICMGSLFLALGNFTPRIAPNRHFGIRTPWTLSDPAIWLTTHRRTGWTSVACGLVLLLSGALVSSVAIQRAMIVAAPVLIFASILSTARKTT